jgi:hypothetical protein
MRVGNRVRHVTAGWPVGTVVSIGADHCRVKWDGVGKTMESPTFYLYRIYDRPLTPAGVIAWLLED